MCAATKPEERAEITDSDPSQCSRAKTPGRQESRTDNEIGVPECDGSQRVSDVLRVVLAVAIYLNSGIVAVAKRVQVTQLNGTADSEIHRGAQNLGPKGLRNRGGTIRRPIVYDTHVPL